MISYNWLKDYVKLPDSITPEEIAEKLKLSTVEVEGIKKMDEDLQNIVVGKILKVEKHPQADKLKLCEVDAGSEKMHVVCGGSNVKEKMLIAFAKLGAKVRWHGEGEPIILEKATIRGVESSGMICGADEIGLSDLFPKKDEKEIVDLTDLKVKPGTELSEALGMKDVVFEIDNKSLSNRPDLWGHYGLAREVAVLSNRDVAAYKVPGLKGNEKINLKVNVQDAESCPRYTAVAIEGVKIEESPLWLKERLLSVGIRPINSVVDITNYIMVDLGQPLHAFDAEKLGLKQDLAAVSIVVRKAELHEKFVTLDEKEHVLSPDMLVIATPEKAVALAGVMGGLDSGINQNTTTIVFESANFEPTMIRKTSTKLGFRTDSSARFEKGLDPTMCDKALSAAVKMLLEICPTAKVISNVEDVGEPHLFSGPLEMPLDFMERRLGIDLPLKNVETILERLGFELKKKGDYLQVSVPSWRSHDCRIPEDVVEEVARINGYQNIPSALPLFPIIPPPENKLRSLERKLGDILVKEFAFTEVYNYSFVSEQQITAIGDDLGLYLELDNPLSKEKPYLRRNLLLNNLDVLKKNFDVKDKIKIFETGLIYQAESPGLRISGKSDELLPRQDTYFLAAILDKKDGRPFKQVKELLEGLAYRLSIDLEIMASEESFPWAHPGRSAKIVHKGMTLGEIYELHPKVGNSFDLDSRVAILSFNLSILAEKISGKEMKKYEPVSLYPEIQRDLAFLINKDVQHGEIVAAITGTDPILKRIELFDIYEGVGGGKKSMAYHLTYADPERTLTSAEAEEVEQKIKKALTDKWGVEFR